MKKVNRGTIIDMQSWCRTWPPNGSSSILAKQKLLRKDFGACKSSWSRVKQKTLQETVKSLPKFLEPTRKPKVINTDNSLEFGKSSEDLSWIHCTSTPHRSETNGIAERACAASRKGLLLYCRNEVWMKNGGADSMERCCYLRNIQDLLSDGKTPFERRFGIPFKGPIIPFGAMVEYYPYFC